MRRLEESAAALHAENVALKDDIRRLEAGASSTIGELKMFVDGRTECPSGFAEANLTKGMALVGLPTDGRSGQQLNRPFQAGEVGRTPTHTHAVFVEDPGHTHAQSVFDPGHTHIASVSDPGHTHTASVSDPGHTHTYYPNIPGTGHKNVNGYNEANGQSNTGNSRTGITVSNGDSKTGIVVSTQPAKSSITARLGVNDSG